ncbi:unnamed protein product [Brugia pahangi]|uniref:EAL domain-containing protein n=1 Tax=Brugia pahangi TaxID=6280 RepID=A0A0N4TTW1_BRUPA|nr:unnamed protein product [Brugia pahangi]
MHTDRTQNPDLGDFRDAVSEVRCTEFYFEVLDVMSSVVGYGELQWDLRRSNDVDRLRLNKSIWSFAESA